MGETWTETTIGALIADHGGSIKTGPFGTTLKAAEYSAEGVPLISVGEIGYGRITIHERTPRVSPAVTSRLSVYLLEEADIVFGRKGAVDRSAIVTKEQSGWFLGSDGIRLRLPKDGTVCEPRYIAYCLQNQEHREWILSHATGTTMPSLNQGVVERIPIPLPPLPEQRSIARVLGGLDDKIELNRRMNRTLEDLARGVFRSWFVDFDPVLRRAGAAGTARGLTPHTPHTPPPLHWPARLVDPPAGSALGPIPEGWRVGTVGEIGANPRRGVLPSEVDSTTPYIGLEHMPRRCIALDDWGTAADVSSGKSRFARGEILFGKLRPYFHKVGVALIDGVCSTDVIVAAPKKECWFGVLLGHLSSDEFIDYVDGASGGTRMPRTSWGDMARYQIAIPPEPIAASFAVWMRRVSELMREHAHESRSLAALRDALLPQLLSGEIRLREAERAVGESLHSAGTPRRGDGITLPRTGKAAGTTKGMA